MITKIQQALTKYATLEKAKTSARFFKTGKGQYGEGDIFIGLTVPEMRVIARSFKDADLKTIEQLLNNKIHEYRLVGLLILVMQFEKAHERTRKIIFDFYLGNRQAVNNWDLVDLTAPNIVGAYLLDKDKELLYRFVKSSSLWERRIAIVATLYFIRSKYYKDTIKISVLLLKDREDLIHKAVGWMLREMGKQDENALILFLDKYYKKMPRTALRYAIERLDVKKKLYYMKR